MTNLPIRRADVSAPVLYDHFASKRELHGRLIQRHLAEMRSVWAEHLAGAGSPEQRIHQALEAWFGYLESHPFAWRMVFASPDWRCGGTTTATTPASGWSRRS